MPAPANHPKLSILVATWNCASELTNFLASLALQEWTDWELVVIDNASTDGTVDLIRQFGFHPAVDCGRVIWCSQPDAGIYDAWNKGINLSTGQYISFIGADDTFVSPKSLGLIAGLTTTSADIITAQNAYFSPEKRFLRFWGSGWKWERMRQSMNIAHPGMLVHRSLFERVGQFDISYKICGDYEWFLRLPPALRTVHSTDVILNIIQSGISHTKIQRVYSETFQAQSRHVGVVSGTAWWFVNWMKYLRRRFIGLA